MVKLQQIKRANGSIVSSVNLPLEIIEKFEWKKGDELKISEWDDCGESIIKISKIGENQDG